jgi:DNA modification methylase
LFFPKYGGSTERYPRSVQVFPSDKQKVKLHPTQKPLDLIEWLIKTYSKENDTDGAVYFFVVLYVNYGCLKY